MTHDWASVFPIQEIKEDCLINGNQDITACWSLRPKEVCTLSDEDYSKTSSDLVRVLRRLPVNSKIHFQGFYYTDAFTETYQGKSVVQRSNFEYFYDRDILCDYLNCYVTFSNRTLTKINAEKNSFLRMGNYVFGRPFKDVEKTIKEYRQYIGPFENDFNLIHGMKASRLRGDQLVGLLHDYFSLGYNKPVKPSEARGKSLPILGIENGYLRIGNQFVGIVSLKPGGQGPKLRSSKNMENLPRAVSKIRSPLKNILPSSMAYPLTFGLPFNHIVNVGIEILDNHDAKKILNNDNGSTNVLAAAGREDAKAKRDQTKAFVDNLFQHGFQACRSTVNVIVNDHDLDRLNEKLNYAKGAFTRMNDSDAWIENEDAANIFFLSSPGNMKDNYRSNIETIDQAVTYVPKETQYFSDADGIVMVDPFGKPCVLNLLNPPVANKNTVFFGPSGTGKSVAMNYITDQFLARPRIKCVIGDVGGSYRRTCSINKGYYFDSSSKKSLQFAPFVCEQDAHGNYLYSKKDQDGEGADDVVNFIYSLMRAIWKGAAQISNEEKNILKDSIRSYYDNWVNVKKVFPDLNQYREFLDVYENEIIDKEYRSFFNFASLRLALDPFTKGEYSYLLNSKSNIDLSQERFVVFDLQGIIKNEDIRDIVFLIVMDLQTRIIQAGDFDQFVSLNDEVVDYLKGDYGDFIAAFFRKIRKHGGRIIAGTQGIDYLDQLDPLVKASILSNCDIKIITDHSNYANLYDSLRNSLSLNPFDMELLKTFEKDDESREVGIKIGNENMKKWRIVLSPFALGVYNTDKDYMDEIYALEKQLGSTAAAINQSIYNRTKRKALKEQTA